MAKKHSAKDDKTEAPVTEIHKKATRTEGAYVHVPGEDEAKLFPVGRTEGDGYVVVVTP